MKIHTNEKKKKSIDRQPVQAQLLFALAKCEAAHAHMDMSHYPGGQMA